MSEKKYKKHHHAEPNEWIPHKATMQWQCCDCGLVHNVWFRIGASGILEVKMTRNQKETKKARLTKQTNG